jgi:heme/copper-type cytochrome/quinol oxidase subunit 3
MPKFVSYSPENKIKANHPFHLVKPSPWPIILSFGVFFAVIAFVASIHNYLSSPFGIISFSIAIGFVIFTLFVWWVDVIQESFEGHHTEPVAKGLRLGFILFIVSEVMFFFSFFWAFFYLALSPSVFIGCQWPPFGITAINPWGFPLLNTLFLLTSGVTVTYAHRAVLQNDFDLAQKGLYNTMRCAYSFMAIQFFEYLLAPFNISDSAFGSTFFMLTGFHGFHVLIGSIYLRVCQFRHARLQFTPDRHIGLETAIWYWHFVDVVWLFLFAIVYVWGGYRGLFANDDDFFW